MATKYINLENILGGDFSDQLKNIIRYKRIGYNIHVMRQSTCLCDRVHTWWLTQSQLTTSLFNCRRNEGSGLNMFNIIGWGSMLCLWSGPLGFSCWISVAPVRVLLLSYLVSTQCCWILIYMIAVLMHTRIRSPSRGPNTLCFNYSRT